MDKYICELSEGLKYKIHVALQTFLHLEEKSLTIRFGLLCLHQGLASETLLLAQYSTGDTRNSWRLSSCVSAHWQESLDIRKVSFVQFPPSGMRKLKAQLIDHIAFSAAAGATLRADVRDGASIQSEG